MKIGFLLENKNIKNVDCSTPQNGNPGIGGTEYSILSVAYYLGKHYKDNYKIFIFAEDIKQLPENTINIQIDDRYNLFEKVKKQNIDILVLRTTEELEIFKLINLYKIKTIMWSHNFCLNNVLTLMSKCEYIVRHVCVGKQQYDRIIDHEIIRKTQVINNIFEICEIDHSYTEKNEKVITYVGSLVPSKGFHILAQQWQKVIQMHPDAKLNVIGSGKLYNRNVKLGEYGIAEENYEKKIMKYLTDSEGNILDSVQFMGTMGEEKKEVYKRTTIGIVNPSARTETFGISAIEFGFYEVPVITLKKNGYLDTIKHNYTGILVSKKKNIFKEINSLLSNPEKQKFLGKKSREHVLKNYNSKYICSSWIEMFDEIVKNQHSSYIPPHNYFFNDFKFLRIINKKVKKLPFLTKIPAIVYYESLVLKIKMKIRGV